MIIGQIELMSWINLFNNINNHILKNKTEESVVPLTDEEYYTHQIHNLTCERDWDRAKRIAKEMASHIKYSDFLKKLKKFETCSNCETNRRDYIKFLSKNGFLYHFDFSAHDICWDNITPTQEIKDALDRATNKLYDEDIFEFAIEFGDNDVYS